MSGDAREYRMSLSRPIEAHGETVEELVLKDPNSAALDGIEIVIGPKGLRLDMGAMPGLIAAMAGIPPSAARKIAMRDTLSHMMGILGFLGIDTQATGSS